MRRSILSTVFGFAAATLLASTTYAANDPVTLKLKYAPGAKSIVSTELKIEQSLTINGGEQESKVEQFMKIATEVGKPAPDGKVAIKQKFDSLQAFITAQGVEIQFDSGSPDKKAENAQFQPVLDMFKVTAQTPWTIVLDKDGRVDSVERKIKNADALDPSFSKLLTNDYLRTTVEQEQGRLPDKPVKVGDTWKRTRFQRLGGGQTMTFAVQYKYAGTEQKDGRTLDKVEVKYTSVKYAMDADSPSPVKLHKSDLKVAESDASYLFDRQKGQIVESVEKVRITGKMTFKADVNGQEKQFPAELDLTFHDKATLEP